MDLKEAKARAYDCITQIELWKGELAKANQLVRQLGEEGTKILDELNEEAEKLDKKIDEKAKS